MYSTIKVLIVAIIIAASLVYYPYLDPEHIAAFIEGNKVTAPVIFIIIFYNRQNGMPQSFEVKTPKGDRTVTKLADIEVDADINSGAFILKMPADVIVRDFTKEIDFN